MDIMKRHEEIEFVTKAGGRFKLTSLLEKRYKELVFGGRPLVEARSNDPLETLLAEVIEDKVSLVPESEAVAAAAAMLMADRSDEAKEELELRARIDARQKVQERAEKEKRDDEEEA